MFLPLMRQRRQDVGITRTVVDGRIIGVPIQSQGDGFTCPKCRRSGVTNVCPFDGTIIVGGHTLERWMPKGTIPFRPRGDDD